jgi:hypothetical protein
MLIVESLENKQTLIQITLDELCAALSAHNNKYFLLGFLNACKKQFPKHVRAIFIGNTKNPNLDIKIPQYIEFAKHVQQKLIVIADNKRVNILKKSCFCILLNDDLDSIKPITKNEYEDQLMEFKTNISNISLDLFKPTEFGLKFEEVLIDILDNKSKHIIQQNQFKSKLSEDNQLLEHDDYSLLTDLPVNNPIIRYFNSYFKSKKNSDCVNLSPQSKTDIFYKNKNGSLNEISVKTRNVHHNDTQLLTAIKFNLSVSGISLLDWKAHLKSDPIKTIKMFFNRQYDTKPDLKSPYVSNKNDNVKFLLMYLYNVDNPNHHVSGNIHILNMKRMFNLLHHYVNHNMVHFNHTSNSLDILVNDELAFKIKNESSKSKTYNTSVYFYLNLNNLSSFFTQLIDFKMPLHLDRECWISHD